jgi:two-component system sensor kinase FixL
MTWQTILYFSSILTTIFLTGFLAGYAWQHRQTLGARTYFGLALSECALALSELLSMLSHTQSQALFWFKVRYFPICAMTIFWLLFALEYCGLKNWVSKRFIVALCIIPVISQLMVWSNRFHSVWVKQEVGFHQNGFLWIADISTRTPGLWFVVHSIFCLLVLLSGIVLILFTAWRMHKDQLGQGLYLAGGAIVGLVFSFISSFNLNPQAEFSPFTPGIGLSALLISIAIFRFKFLSKTETKGNSRQRWMDAQEKRSLIWFLLIFILVISGFTSVGYISYSNYEKEFRTQVENQLSAISLLKVNQLEEWMNERLDDAALFYQNDEFSGLVGNYLENPTDPGSQDRLNQWLEKIQDKPDYERVFLLDTEGRERISSPAGTEPFTSYLHDQVTELLTSGQMTMLDFQRDTTSDSIHLSILVPIFTAHNGSPLGVLILRIDPEVTLYPFLNEWPTPSQSAETLLIRRDGEAVLFLNPLRFQPEAALSLRIPLEATEILAVKAVLGQEGAIQGTDYRGIEVIGDVRPVADSPWFLVARIDSTEVFAPLRGRLWQSVVFFGVLILLVFAGLGLVWRQESLRLFRTQVAATEAQRESAEQYQSVILTATDAIIIINEHGNITSWNPAAEQIFGYSADEIFSQPLDQIMPEGTREVHRFGIQHLITSGETHLIGKTVEVIGLRKSGDEFPLELSLAKWETTHGAFFTGIIRDISERKYSEQQLAKYSEHLEEMVDERTKELNIAREQLVRQEKLAILGKLAGSIGHELRNPLAVISNSIYLLNMKLPDADDKTKEYLNIIENETRTSNKIITDLLNFARTTKGEGGLVLVSDLFDQSLSRFPVTNSIEVTIDLAPDLPRVVIDIHQMTQVLGNLVVNACQAMPDGGKLTLSAHQQEQSIAIAVIDTGVGIQLENMAKLFEPLYTTKAKGIGLGLAVSKILTEANGGRIAVQSEPGKGSTFTLYLPVLKGER